MRLFTLAASVCFSLASCPAADAWSPPPGDLEGSGHDLEGSGHDLEVEGSGAGPEGVIFDEKSTYLGKGGKDIAPTETQEYEGHEQEHEQPWNRKPIVVKESKSFVESKEVLAGVIAGGVGGFVLGVVLAGFLICKWQKKYSTGYSQGMRRTDRDYPRDPRAVLRGEEAVFRGGGEAVLRGEQAVLV